MEMVTLSGDSSSASSDSSVVCLGSFAANLDEEVRLPEQMPDVLAATSEAVPADGQVGAPATPADRSPVVDPVASGEEDEDVLQLHPRPDDVM